MRIPDLRRYYFLFTPSTCPSRKLCPPVFSIGYVVAVHRQSAIAPWHDSCRWTSGRCHSSTLPCSSQAPPREPVSPPPTRSAEAETAQIKNSSIRQALLGLGTEVLVQMETGPHYCECVPFLCGR